MNITSTQSPALYRAPAATSSARPDDHGFDTDNLDPSVRPQDDFYQYAVGGWNSTHPIPDDKTAVGSFDQLAEKNRAQLHEILEDLAQGPAPQAGSNEQKLRDFYKSGMDLDTIEAAGARPLQPEFDRIASICDQQSLQSELAHLHNQGNGSIFNFGADQDAKHSTQMIGEADQGGLGLPNRSYYLESDPRSAEIRQAYQDHIAHTLQLLGDTPENAQAAAQTVLRMETRLAENSMTDVERRDPEKTYHIMDRSQLSELTPNLDWGQYFHARGAGDLQTINLASPKFFEGLDKMLVDTPIGDWKTYLRWHTISASSYALSSDFVNENFNFSKVMSGVKEQAPRWKKIVAATDGALGEALGQKFVEKTFTPESRARASEMLGNVRAVLKDDLTTLPWMSADTRKEAIGKLEAIDQKIGYPDKWTDYSDLPVQSGVYVNNILQADEWATRKDLEKIGKPVDRGEWHMTPPTVNAYYNARKNEIVFPAGILQAPFFNSKADDAINYGAIGVVMGHEITHGFDDKGSLSDADGNLRNWWTDEDKARFDQRRDGIIKQADDYAVQGDLHLNGKRVVGEAMADLGGVELAYAALEKSLQGKSHARIDGFTPEQRFFLGFAQVWERNTRPEAEQQQVKTDPHPVPRFRVNGTLSNVPEFAQAWGAKDGDPMVRPTELRTTLWEKAPA